MKPTLATLRRFVGNPDAWAYQRVDGTWQPMRQPLTDAVLLQHLALEMTVGTYVNLVDKARTLVFDLDNDSITDALKVEQSLIANGIPKGFIGIEDSGRKGWHVWVVLTGFVPAEQLRRFGRSVLAWAEVECEAFPKQDKASDLGNLVKLPGGMHQMTGRHNDFLGKVPTMFPVSLWEHRIVPDLPEQFHGRAAGGAATRFPCMENIANGLAEGGRNIALFQYATLARRAGLTGAPLAAAVRAVNDAFTPPLTDYAVEGVLKTSEFSGPICDQLPEDRRCKDGLCIKDRTAGLNTRPGQMRHAGIGEGVVVTLSGRTGKTVRFTHDDLELEAKGVLQ